MGENVCDPRQGLKPVIIMFVVQAVVSGVNVFYKLAVIDGMSMRVLISYRFIFATAFLVPLALILERRKKAGTFNSNVSSYLLKNMILGRDFTGVPTKVPGFPNVVDMRIPRKSQCKGSRGFASGSSRSP
ncbi:hypothetical protein REPUB_Repub09cG0109200 [Reevesia pubescens]